MADDEWWMNEGKVEQEQKVLKTSAPRANFMCLKQTFKISIKKVTKNRNSLK